MGMLEGLGIHENCDLTQVVREASRALAQLDVGRLEELARSCEKLNSDGSRPPDFGRGARDAATEMAVFARVLDVTRANLEVMRRLRDLQKSRMSYGGNLSQDKRAARSGSGLD